MGNFINVTDTDLLNGVFNVPPTSAVPEGPTVGQQDQQPNQASQIVQDLQPLNETGQELIDRFQTIDRLETEVNARQRADELFTELDELLQEPTDENLAAAEDVRDELSSLSFTNQDGENELIISDDDFNRARFDIPGETLENLGELINENANELQEAEETLQQERDDLEEFFNESGIQTGDTFNNQGEVITSFINVASTGQLLDSLV